MTEPTVFNHDNFREYLYQYPMPHVDHSLPVESLIDRLVTFRFPFSEEGLGEPFIQNVRQSLTELPEFLLRAMTYYQFHVQLDTCHEIGAIMDIANRSMYLHRFFLMDKTAYELINNPVYPYSVTETMLHELGHFLDYMLTQGNKLSATPLFLQAIRKDTANIPESMKIDHAIRQQLCEEAGGYLKLSNKNRIKSELALFGIQIEETFAESFLFLASGGRSREVIPLYFPNTIDAVAYLLRYHLQRWSPTPM